MSDALKFDLDLKAKPVEIGGDAYVLVELTGMQRDRYLTAIAGRLKQIVGSKRATVKNFDGLQSSLVGMALRRVKDGATVVPPSGGSYTAEMLKEQTDPVSEKMIQEWPAAVGSALFRVAKELSGLNDEEDEDAEGNDDKEDEDAEGND